MPLYIAVGIINMGENKTIAETWFKDLGLEREEYEVFDIWGNKMVGSFK